MSEICPGKTLWSPRKEDIAAPAFDRRLEDVQVPVKAPKILAAVIACTRAPYSAATECTNSVLPHPGGPCSRTPFSQRNPSSWPAAAYRDGQPAKPRSKSLLTRGEGKGCAQARSQAAVRRRGCWVQHGSCLDTGFMLNKSGFLLRRACSPLQQEVI